MNDDIYVIDDNGSWRNPEEALDWYRTKVSDLKREIESYRKAVYGLNDEIESLRFQIDSVEKE